MTVPGNGFSRPPARPRPKNDRQELLAARSPRQAAARSLRPPPQAPRLPSAGLSASAASSSASTAGPSTSARPSTARTAFEPACSRSGGKGPCVASRATIEYFHASTYSSSCPAAAPASTTRNPSGKAFPERERAAPVEAEPRRHRPAHGHGGEARAPVEGARPQVPRARRAAKPKPGSGSRRKPRPAACAAQRAAPPPRARCRQTQTPPSP